MIYQDLPKLMSCRLTGKSEEDKQKQAEAFIYNATELSQSKYQADDYEMQIINNTAFFTRIKE